MPSLLVGGVSTYARKPELDGMGKKLNEIRGGCSVGGDDFV